jgi:hypothetical protein
VARRRFSIVVANRVIEPGTLRSGESGSFGGVLLRFGRPTAGARRLKSGVMPPHSKMGGLRVGRPLDCGYDLRRRMGVVEIAAAETEGVVLELRV